jgi:hypothetical protein
LTQVTGGIVDEETATQNIDNRGYVFFILEKTSNKDHLLAKNIPTHKEGKREGLSKIKRI